MNDFIYIYFLLVFYFLFILVEFYDYLKINFKFMSCYDM